MSIINLDKIFKPRRIALLGSDWHLGASVLANLLDAGFQGVVYPIDSGREAINGVPVYPSVDELPKTPDVALICTPAEQAPQDVETCARAGMSGAVVLSGGFREVGEKGRTLEREIAGIIKTHPEFRVLGPNSLGFIAPRLHLNASHAATMPKAGQLVFISESRALCGSMIDWALEADVGFSYFVSVGNMLNVGFGDLIDYFSTDPNTRAIILYLQSIDNARHFMSAASAFSRKKPIVAYKAGHFAESARIVASHTGAMVAEDAVYGAAFERAGVVRVTDLSDVFDVAEVLASQRIPKGPRLAMVGNAGGPLVIATDVLLGRGGVLATLSPHTVEELKGVLPSVGAYRNPVDLQDDASPERFSSVLRVLLTDPAADGVLVIFSVQKDVDSRAVAEAIVEVARGARKPVLAVWMGGTKVRGCAGILSRSGIPTHNSPEQAVRAFLYLVTYARNIDMLYQTPRDIPLHFNLNRTRLRKRLAPLLQAAMGALNEYQAKSFLNAYGIPVANSRVAQTREAAVSFAKRVGYPVVLKVSSPKVLHKVDVGGVALGLGNEREVARAYEEILENVRNRYPDASVEGVTVQKMIELQHGLEMILGAKKDPTFGSVLMVGMGGFAADVIHDQQVGLPPLNERMALRMLESLRHWPMLQDYRGRPGLALDKLVEIMLRFSCLITDYPEIREFDINPLLVGVDGVVALDAAVILDDDNGHSKGNDFVHEHVAIRPYPKEHVRRVTMKEGRPVTFRPVKPEDEPMWHRLIGCSSERSLRQRFRSFFSSTTHQMAVEYCVIDYEREIAIVAETVSEQGRELIGVAHLFADASLDNAEYAVIVSDPWQGLGLGGMLLDHCLGIARGWGIRKVVADTEIGNKAMLKNFRTRGFESRVDYEDGIVYLHKPMFQ
uniref:Acetyltransferase n=1 Tax=Candidatus Kentrum sp. MB TaxID=2138164 RepID=A0A451BC12_9GAMM|nr:MAG: acetyltransferase [Candidatus Kentron sp. MB]VFK32321.1 MAG: acetyltransferase [Candidatus Kentron sp. MB]VFK75827.1 MAG: acetyltransferase [Candidatus Kentron sp. MB]